MLTPGASVTDLFLELVAIPSPSGRERALGEQVQAWLAAAGVTAAFDGTGERNDSDAGNLIATVPGDPGAPVYLFVAHLDTVESGAPPVTARLGPDGVIRSDGTTILGADNKSAVAAVMCLCRAAAARRPAPGAPTIVAAFTCREESGRMGAAFLDPDGRSFDCAFCVDGSQPIGTVITRAYGQATFALAVHGRAAHAAAAPESGVSAIAVAAEIIAALTLGRRPDGGTASIAAIIGGTVADRWGGHGAAGRDGARAALLGAPTNSVPDLALLKGEVRGYTVASMEEAIAELSRIADAVCAARGARAELIHDPGRMIPPMPGRPGSRALACVRAAAASLPGMEVLTEEAHATLEANYLAADLDVVALASGGRDPHRHTESITVAELTQLEALLRAIAQVDGESGDRLG